MWFALQLGAEGQPGCRGREAAKAWRWPWSRLELAEAPCPKARGWSHAAGNGGTDAGWGPTASGLGAGVGKPSAPAAHQRVGRWDGTHFCPSSKELLHDGQGSSNCSASPLALRGFLGARCAALHRHTC